MTDTQILRPATPDEIAETLSFALRYRGRKRVHDADDAMAQITAERLVRHLEASGFVFVLGVLDEQANATSATARVKRRASKVKLESSKSRAWPMIRS